MQFVFSFGALLVLCLLNCGALPHIASAHDSKNFAREIRSKVQNIMKRQDIPGLSIAIVHRNDLIFAEGFGLANIEKNTRAAADTVYGIASVSKVFTATAFMQMVDQRLIDIHAPVKRYLPKFRLSPPLEFPEGPFAAITPFNLLIHYAGLPKQSPPRTGDDAWIPQTLAEFMEDLYQRSRLIYPPNFRYSYSNPGISVLGRIIEVVAEEDFESHLQRRLLKPLEMNRSSFSNRGFSEVITNNLAQGYSRRDTPVNRPPIAGIPAGNLHSTVLDIANFMKMYLNNGNYRGQQLVNSDTIKTMLTIQNKELREQDPEHSGPDQGLVWILNNDDIPGRPKTARHNGKMVGFSSMLILLPEEQLGLVVLTNIRNPSIKPGEIALAALAVAREKY